MKTLAWAVALTTAIAAPAFAAQPAADTNSAAQSKMPAQAQAGQWRASKMVGINIYGPDNKSIGEVNEVLIDRNGSVAGVVVGVGGFLGMGEKNVALKFNEVKWMDQPAQASTVSNANPPVNTTQGNDVVTGTDTAANTNQGKGAQGTEPTDVTGSVRGIIRDYPDHGVVSFTYDQLKGMPDFHYASEGQ